jgi:perosamine synthetase
MIQPRLRLYTKKRMYFDVAVNLLGICTKNNKIKKAESLLKSTYGANDVVLTSMGRMAIYFALKALSKTGEVIVSPITVPEVIQLIRLSGCTPVFCDIELGTWNFDVRKVPELITKDTVAIMTTYYYGDSSSCKEIKKICLDNDLIMIEDAAQAVGVKTELGYAGTIGDFGVYSFSYPKNVTSFYGGALLVQSKSYEMRVRQIVNSMGQKNKKWYIKKVFDCLLKDVATSKWIFPLVFKLIQVGFKYDIPFLKKIGYQHLSSEYLQSVPTQYLTKISELQASWIIKSLNSVNEDMQYRISIAKIYNQLIFDNEKLIKPRFTTDGSHGYLYYPLQVEDKYDLQSYLIINGVDVAVQHTPNCQGLPANHGANHPCPNAQLAAKGTLMLPTYPGFGAEQAADIARLINLYVQQS